MISPIDAARIAEEINASCLSSETMKYIYNQSYQLAWNYGLLMLFAGLLFGAVIGIGIYRFFEEEK